MKRAPWPYGTRLELLRDVRGPDGARLARRGVAAEVVDDPGGSAAILVRIRAGQRDSGNEYFVAPADLRKYSSGAGRMFLFGLWR